MYHIENYLLEEKYILRVLSDVSAGDSKLTESEVSEELLKCAQRTISSLVAHEVSSSANKRIISALNLRVNPESTDVARDLSQSIQSSLDRLQKVCVASLGIETLVDEVSSLSESLQRDLISGNWRSTFRGRDILKRFVAEHGSGLKYNHFRNLIISKMRDDNFKPKGMKSVLEKVMTPQKLRIF